MSSHVNGRSPSLVVLATSVWLAGCTAHFAGALAVDGAPFAPVECRSGLALGFGGGVEIADATGHRLRLAPKLDGTAVAAVFQPGALAGEQIGACGTMWMQSQHSRVNGVVNMQGAAILSCQSAAHQLSGQIQFENCH
jgi:hypothetical protein